MEITSFKEVRIIKPCHENWDLMKKREGGRFCQNCKELVHDFTKATESDLNILYTKNNGNLCGQFYEDQITQGLDLIPPSQSIFSKFKNYFYSVWTFILLNLIPHKQSQATISEKCEVYELTAINGKKQVQGDSSVFTLKVIDQKRQPVSGANIELKDKSGNLILYSQTDKNGDLVISFNDSVAKNKMMLRVQKQHREKGYMIKSEKFIRLDKQDCNNLIIKINLNKGKRTKMRRLRGRVMIRPYKSNTIHLKP